MDNKSNILNCSLKLFSKKGYDSVSVQELVNESNITKPTLYYYFKSKEGLYNELLKKYYFILNERLEKVCIYNPNPDSYNLDIFPVLENIINTYFIFAKNHPSFCRIILTNQYMPNSSSIYDITKKYDDIQYKLILNTFNNMANTHTNLKAKEKKLTWSFIGLINAYISLFLQDSTFNLSSMLAKEIVHQFMHGIYA